MCVIGRPGGYFLCALLPFLEGVSGTHGIGRRKRKTPGSFWLGRFLISLVSRRWLSRTVSLGLLERGFLHFVDEAAKVRPKSHTLRSRKRGWAFRRISATVSASNVILADVTLWAAPTRR